MAEYSLLRIGARGSNLSRRQTEEVCDALIAARPALTFEVVYFVTAGDRQLDTPLPLMGGKGVFTTEIEAALRDGQIDLAVHSLKDLPVENPDGIAIGGVPKRAPVADCLISRDGRDLIDLPANAVIGTSSNRRSAQLAQARPDLRSRSIRGNVETRIRKALDLDGEYDAIVLAQAGLSRLGLLDQVTQDLPLDVMLPAPGQAALAIQCRDDAESIAVARLIDHVPTHLAVLAERAFLAGLGGGCSAPIAAFGEFDGDYLTLRGRVISIDGMRAVDVQWTGPCANPEGARAAGQTMAAQAIDQGAADLLGASL